MPTAHSIMMGASKVTDSVGGVIGKATSHREAKHGNKLKQFVETQTTVRSAQELAKAEIQSAGNGLFARIAKGIVILIRPVLTINFVVMFSHQYWTTGNVIGPISGLTSVVCLFWFGDRLINGGSSNSGGVINKLTTLAKAKRQERRNRRRGRK